MAASAKTRPNPFKPGTAHRPPLLAGRNAETRLLAEALDLLCGEREKRWGPLASDPLPPIKIVGPRGVGKTVLLAWAERQARERGIRCVPCEGLRPNEADFSMRKLLGDISLFQRALGWLKGFSLSAAEKFGAGVELHQATAAFTSVAGGAVRRRPLLLLMDEVQHYDLALLRAVLQGSQRLIRQGYPLGLVLAGTPGLESRLAKAESTFIARSQSIYINTLSDEATRAALRVPFEREGATVAPDALAALAAQTDNYPYFIQVAGRAAWAAMTAAGRQDIDAATVKRIEGQVRKGRNSLYSKAWLRMYACDLMPCAHQVIGLLDDNGGRVPEKAVLDLLRQASGGKDAGEFMPLYEALREDGLIWTEDGETKPGIPSFFSYCKDRERSGTPPAGGGAQPRNWLPDFLPGFSLPAKRG